MVCSYDFFKENFLNSSFPSDSQRMKVFKDRSHSQYEENLAKRLCYLGPLAGQKAKIWEGPSKTLFWRKIDMSSWKTDQVGNFQKSKEYNKPKMESEVEFCHSVMSQKK